MDDPCERVEGDRSEQGQKGDDAQSFESRTSSGADDVCIVYQTVVVLGALGSVHDIQNRRIRSVASRTLADRMIFRCDVMLRGFGLRSVTGDAFYLAKVVLIVGEAVMSRPRIRLVEAGPTGGLGAVAVQADGVTALDPSKGILRVVDQPKAVGVVAAVAIQRALIRVPVHAFLEIRLSLWQMKPLKLRILLVAEHAEIEGMATRATMGWHPIVSRVVACVAAKRPVRGTLVGARLD